MSRQKIEKLKIKTLTYLEIVNSTFGCLIELPSMLGNLTKEGLQTKF